MTTIYRFIYQKKDAESKMIQLYKEKKISREVFSQVGASGEFQRYSYLIVNTDHYIIPEMLRNDFKTISEFHESQESKLAFAKMRIAGLFQTCQPHQLFLSFLRDLISRFSRLNDETRTPEMIVIELQAASVEYGEKILDEINRIGNKFVNDRDGLFDEVDALQDMSHIWDIAFIPQDNDTRKKERVEIGWTILGYSYAYPILAKAFVFVLHIEFLKTYSIEIIPGINVPIFGSTYGFIPVQILDKIKGFQTEDEFDFYEGLQRYEADKIIGNSNYFGKWMDT